MEKNSLLKISGQLKLAYVLAYCVLPLFGAAWFGVSGETTARLCYLVVSILCCSSLVLVFKSTRQLLHVAIFFAIGAWFFLALLIKHHGVPVVMLLDILNGSGYPEVREYLIANQLLGFVILVLLGAMLSWYFTAQMANLNIHIDWRKKVFAFAALTIAISLQWDYFPWQSPPFPSPVSDMAASEIYPIGLSKLVYLGVQKFFNKAPPKQAFHATRSLTPGEPETHVLIIGETSRYDRWNMNGYPRQTSPNLGRLPANELLNFSKVHGGGNLTIMAVPILLTGTLPEDFASVESKPNILDLMKELGFMTVWLSNQDDSVLRGSKINADLMLNRENIMLEPKFMFEKARFDGDLLPILDRILSYSKTKKFIVLHTSGSHMDYHIRYPEQFKKFSSLNDSMYTPEQQMNKQDAYDNSILYTDWVVSQVIERLNQQPGLVSVTYLSDHGEDMYDDVQQRAGHGTVDSSLYEQHIPFYFWGNAALRSHYQDKWNSLIRNRNRQFGGENYLHTWADFLDIDYPDQKKNLSIVQTNYMQRKNAKVLGGNANLLNIKIAD